MSYRLKKFCHLFLWVTCAAAIFCACSSYSRDDYELKKDMHFVGLRDCTDDVNVEGWDIAGAMYMKDGRLLVYYSAQSRQQARLCTYDTDGWAVIHEAYVGVEGYPQFRLSYQLDGGLSLTDLKSGIYYFYDAELSLAAKCVLKCQSIENSVAAKDGSGVYYVGDEGNTLLFLDVGGGASEVLVELPEGLDSLHIEDMTDDGQTVILTYFNNNALCPGYLFLSKNQSPEYLDNVSYSIKEAEGSYFVSGYMLDNSITVFDTEKPRLLLSYTFDNNYERLSFAAFPKAHLIITWDGQSTLRAYDMDAGTLKNRVSIDVEGDNASMSISERNPVTMDDQAVACIPVYGDAGLRIYLWDCSQTDIEDGSECDDVQLMAKQIERETGVDIVWGEEAAGTFPGFAAVQVTDKGLILKGLCEIKKSLLKYPADFFKEFTYGDIANFNIYLCSGLSREGQPGESPSAAAMIQENTQSIILDISDSSSIGSNLAHEIMHAIDAKIDYEIKNRGFTGFDHDVWNELNPPDFVYMYSYADAEGKAYTKESVTRYTPDDELSFNDLNNIYFTDYYSCTYPTEDRARIFECLMTSDDELPWFFESCHLRSKAKYMCTAIRQSFADVMPEVAYWERLIAVDDDV